jgi:hypothetical protein
METDRLNIANGLLQTTELSSNTLDIKRESDKILCRSNQIYFVICNSCYWCASYFGLDDLQSLSESRTRVLDCHVCNSCNTELIPISGDESFSFVRGQVSGVTSGFWSSIGSVRLSLMF